MKKKETAKHHASIERKRVKVKVLGCIVVFL